MSEISIQGGFTHPQIDPLRFLLVDAARPDVQEQDPAVTDRCPAILKDTLDLILRFTDPARLSSISAQPETPPVGYKTPEGHEGVIRLVGSISQLEVASEEAPTYNMERSLAFLYGGASADQILRRPLITLRADRIERYTAVGNRAGSQADLNFIQTVTAKIREAAFPKPK